MTQRRIDRLDEFIAKSGLNDSRLTKTAGLSVGTLGKSRKAGKDITIKAVNKILLHYPNLSREWLMFGKGAMMSDEVRCDVDYISYPLIETSKAECGKAAGLAEAAMVSSLPRIALPGIPRETEFFIQASGYSMINRDNPNLSIPPTSLVGLSKINSGIIRWGEIYAIVTVDGVMLKRILPDNDNPDCVRCLSYNEEEFPEFTLRKEDIKEVARITCVIPVIVR